MTDGVAIGTAIVSYIEPHAGQECAFNRWYERDHFPAAVTAGPGVFSGARFVATHACKEARPNGTLFGDPARGSYLSLAWVLPDMQAAWDAFVIDTMPRLRAQDRMFAGRDHLHTAVYTPVSEQTDSIVMALDRAYAGVIAVASTDELAVRAFTEAIQPAAATIIELAPERTILSLAEPADHRLVLAFCTIDPLEMWGRFGKTLPEDSLGFASPFLRTIPGTDAYVDAL